MPKINVGFGGGAPLFDIASYARRGPGRRDRLSPADIALITRTAHRAPEVMVKVVSGGNTKLASVAKHIDYITRAGELALETDGGERVQGRDEAAGLMDQWNLDLETHRRRACFKASEGCKPSKLVHKLVLSMPAGTPPEGVSKAATHFLHDEFASTHRYAFVLHTDTPHPHVHVCARSSIIHVKRTHLYVRRIAGLKRDGGRVYVLHRQCGRQFHLDARTAVNFGWLGDSFTHSNE